MWLEQPITLYERSHHSISHHCCSFFPPYIGLWSSASFLHTLWWLSARLGETEVLSKCKQWTGIRPWGTYAVTKVRCWQLASCVSQVCRFEMSFISWPARCVLVLGQVLCLAFGITLCNDHWLRLKLCSSAALRCLCLPQDLNCLNCCVCDPSPI